MISAMTHETPGKIFALLGTALFSLAFLFGVSITEASFNGTSQTLPDPFAAENLVAGLDQAAASYSRFLSVNLLQPLSSDYEVYADNINWVAKESGVISFLLGTQSQSLAMNQNNVQASAHGKVAGAYKEQIQYAGGFNIDSIYQILIK